MSNKKEIDMLKVMGDNILIDPDPIMDGKTTKSGLYIPNMKKDDYPMWGKVVKIGENVENIKVGDSIMMRGFRAGSVKFDENEKEYYFAKEKEIIAIIPA